MQIELLPWCVTQSATQNEHRAFATSVAMKKTVKFQEHDPHFCVSVRRRSEHSASLQEGLASGALSGQWTNSDPVICKYYPFLIFIGIAMPRVRFFFPQAGKGAGDIAVHPQTQSHLALAGEVGDHL